ncbi:MAG: nitronate monooxygenase [bacterium]|nr:nitronate monooxygenase [bacterium]
MHWKTRITERLGIQYPIIEGAMVGLGTVDLAAAISEAGGLGMINGWMLRTPEKLRKVIHKARSLTNRPFAVNFSPTMDEALLPMLDVAIEEKVPIIETAGSRAIDFGEKIKEAGLVWIHKAYTLKHAIRSELDGADAVVMMGVEGAGLKTPTMLTTFVTIAMAAKQLSIPIIAAGGIGDARTFLGALALGAEAVTMGSVFCAVKECPLADHRKQVLVEADPYDPKWRDPILTTPKLDGLQTAIESEGRKDVLLAVGKAEDVGIPKEAGTASISLAIGFINDVLTAKELIDKIIGEAEEILTSGGMGGWRFSPQ